MRCSPQESPSARNVVPDPTRDVGAVAALEASVDPAIEYLVMLRANARAPVEPGMEARAGHVQRTAQPCHRPDAPVPRDESEPHVPSLAK